MTDSIALLSHTSPTAIVAYRSGLAVTAQQFLDEAKQVAQKLPKGNHVLNVCADRYQFTVGLAACLMSERVSLLPSTHTPQVIAQLAAFAPDAFCLTDDRRCDIGLARVYYPDLVRPAASLATSSFEVPRIALQKNLGLAGALRSERRGAVGLVGRQKPCPRWHGTRPAHVRV